MERIPPNERFSKNAKIAQLPAKVVLEALLRFGLSSNEWQVSQLSGGFMNSNFSVSRGSEKFVFRVYSTDLATAQRETDLLRFLANRPILVPKIHDLFCVDEHPVAVLEQVEGMTLEEKLLSDATLSKSLFEEIGAQLAAIHSVTFAEAGFIGPDLKIGREYESFANFIREYITRVIPKVPEERLDSQLRSRMLKLVEEKWDLVVGTEPPHERELVHCDFNPKNMLVSKGGDTRLVAVLDWEFCLSGNGLIDVGNFFRFAYDYPDFALTAFVKGYQSTGPKLGESEILASKLLDLGNMCSFLERRENYVQSFRTARAVIRSTLESFGY